MTIEHDLLLLSATVYMEAGAEPPEGRLGVAFAIMNRARSRSASVSDVCLQPWQFSAWNTDSPTRRNLDTIPVDAWRDCYKASCAAYFELVADPTLGARNYLNEKATRAGRSDGSLPGWFHEEDVTIRIGNHTFLR